MAEVQRLIRVALSAPQTVVQLPAAELDLLLRILRRVRLHGHLAESLKKAGCFHELRRVAKDQLESVLALANSRERVARWELDRIEWALSDQTEVDLVCLKGCAYLITGLPNTPGRIFADVDLLVAEDELDHVEQILNVRGWSTTKLDPYDDNYYRRWTHELPPLTHVEREVEIDLHHNIVPRTARLRPSAESILAKSLQVESSRYRVLANEDLVLHAMVHLMFDSDLADKLRDLVDIDILLRHFCGLDEKFWTCLIHRAGELRITRPAYYSLRYVKELLDGPVPEDVIGKIEVWAPAPPVRWLMDRFVPRALFPQHPERPSRLTTIARLLLYMRSHWLRMPPWLLAYHLSYKFIVTRVRPLVYRQRAESAEVGPV
jgi:hypothetical protein